MKTIARFLSVAATVCGLSLWAQDKEHAAAIKSGDVQFVVVRGKKSPGKNYVAVDQCAFPFEGRKWTYTLYQRIDP